MCKRVNSILQICVGLGLLVLLGAQQKALRWVAPPQRPAPESPVAADPSTESEAPREPLTLAVTLPDAFAPR